MSAFFIATSYNLITNFVSILLFSLTVMVFIWPIKRFSIDIYVDAMVFRENGWHPLIKNEFGVAFENIYEYKIKRIGLTLNWIVLKRTNGKTLRRLLSLSNREFTEFDNILKSKTIDNN